MERLPPIPSPPGTAFREFRVNIAPVLVFSLLFGLTAFLWRSYVGPAALVGEAEVRRSLVTSTQPGRIARLLVASLEKVDAGQPVAEVLHADPRMLQAQAELSRARLEFVRSGIEPRLRRDNNQINYLNLRLDWMRDRVDLATLKAQLAFHEFEYERVKRLQGTNTTGFPISSIFDLQVAERDLAALRARIAEQGQLVDQMGESMSHLDPALAEEDDDLSGSVKAALAVEEQALVSIEDQLRPIPLTAPMGGFISVVHRRDGENVLAGEPILTISADRAEHIIAYVRQPFTTEPSPGQRLTLRSRGRGGQAAEAQVVRIGSHLEPILPELIPLRPGGSSTVEYGLPILVNIPDGFRILPGEMVDLHLLPN